MYLCTFLLFYRLVIVTDTDDNTLTFAHPASELFQKEEEKTVIIKIYMYLY